MRPFGTAPRSGRSPHQRPDLILDFLLGLLVLGDLLRRRQRMIVIHVAEDHRHRAVIIHARDRIELVIVATSAVDREPHEALERRADHVVQIFVTVVGIVLLAKAHTRADAIVGRRDQAVVVPVVEFVAGELLDDEPVVGLVLVECLDDVVAVAPGVGDVAIMLVA